MSGTVFNTRDAITTQAQNYKLKFEVEEIGPYKRMQRVGRRAEAPATGLVFKDEVVEVPGAYVVYFPSGHSLRIERKEEMIRLGYMNAAPIVDMETGEEVPVTDTLSPKEIVKRATANRRSPL